MCAAPATVGKCLLNNYSGGQESEYATVRVHRMGRPDSDIY